MVAEEVELNELLLARHDADHELSQVNPSCIRVPQIQQFSVVSLSLQAAAAIQPPVIVTDGGGERVAAAVACLPNSRTPGVRATGLIAPARASCPASFASRTACCGLWFVSACGRCVDIVSVPLLLRCLSVDCAAVALSGPFEHEGVHVPERRDREPSLTLH